MAVHLFVVLLTHSDCCIVIKIDNGNENKNIKNLNVMFEVYFFEAKAPPILNLIIRRMSSKL